MTTPATEATSATDNLDTAAIAAEPAGNYAVSPNDSITLMAGKIIRDIIITRGEPVRRRDLWLAVDLVMGDRSPDVDGVLKRDWFNNQGTGPGRWELTDAANAQDSPFTDGEGIINLARVADYLRRCGGRAPYVGDAVQFINICQPKLMLDTDWIIRSGRSIA